VTTRLALFSDIYANRPALLTICSRTDPTTTSAGFTHAGRYDAKADVICFGHADDPYHREIEGVHVIDTGSDSRPNDGEWRAGYCVLTIDGSEVRSEADSREL
jgi:predicted phosphodiesterase